jgi:putative salt-induced outer membrane protein
MPSPALAMLLFAGAQVEAVALEPSSASLPEGIRRMIEAAIASGDAQAIETVLRLARETHGFAGAEIDEIEQKWKLRVTEAQKQQKEQKSAALAKAGITENWNGQVELGASRSTGRSSYFGLYGSARLEREGVEWRHKLEARAEIQEGRNVTDTSRVVGSWQPNYKIGERLYAYGLAQYESDERQGYRVRHTAGGGLGYSLQATPTARLEFEGGPAYRQVRPTLGPSQSSLAGRGSVNLNWTIAPTVELKQSSALYFEGGDSSASALTMVDATLIAPLKARFSYDVRYESGVESESTLDTLSRVTLVYSF